ncbi:MAG: hypothetical protein QW263_05835, partial [Nitrososphaerota archaeon]
MSHKYDRLTGSPVNGRRRRSGQVSSLSLILFAFAITVLLVIFASFAVSALRVSVGSMRGAEEAVRASKESIDVRLIAELYDHEPLNGFYDPGRDEVIPKVRVQNLSPYEVTIDKIVVVCKPGSNPCARAAARTISGKPVLERDLRETLAPLADESRSVRWLHPALAAYESMADGWWRFRDDVEAVHLHTTSGGSFLASFGTEVSVVYVVTITITHTEYDTVTVTTTTTTTRSTTTTTTQPPPTTTTTPGG